MSIPPTSDPNPQGPEATPSRRRRARRPQPARRFTGVGRHGDGDTAAVEAAQALAMEAIPPVPVPAGPGDEFDVPTEHAATVLWDEPLTEDELASEVAWGPDHQLWLAAAEEEAGTVEHHHSGYGDAMQRLGTVPAGYLPAEDLFSEQEADMAGRRKRRRRRGLVLTSIILVIVLAIGVGGWWVIKQLTAPPADYPGPGTTAVSFTVEDGWGSKQISRGLLNDGVIKSTQAFDAAMDAAVGGTPVFHPGTYDLKKEMTAADALSALAGTDKGKVTYFALPANTRLPAALELISEGTGLDLDELTKLANTPTAFGLPAADKTIEGYLHPGDYRLPVGTDAKTVLTTAIDRTKETLTSLGVTKPAEQKRILTIASIVAAEAMPKDFAMVSGIIDNRLRADNTQTGGLLQIDSTVTYGLGQTSLHFTSEQRKDASNPYNTYVHKGLPPTPIGSPGDAAITAAVNPEANPYYFWVTVNIKTGETKFSKTYSEHLKYVDEYKAYCKANEGVCT